MRTVQWYSATGSVNFKYTYIHIHLNNLQKCRAKQNTKTNDEKNGRPSIMRHVLVKLE